MEENNILNKTSLNLNNKISTKIPTTFDNNTPGANITKPKMNQNEINQFNQFSNIHATVGVTSAEQQQLLNTTSVINMSLDTESNNSTSY